MPLAGPLRAWIAKCKAYAAQHGCSYKEAMSALGGKGKKSHRHKSHRGGNAGVADSAAEYNGVEGAANMAGPPPPPPPPTEASPDAPPPQTGGGMASAFEVGAMTGMNGGRRRRRGSKRGGSKRRGSKRGGSKRRGSKRGGALSYSEF